MDWMERQIPPPSWHDEGIVFQDLEDDSYSPLTSVVRRCYINHLQQTLLQNYNSCRTQTIQPSTLQDVLLVWEQSALRSCMVTTLYQKAMRQLINAIKDDTKKHKLTSVLKATIKRSQRQHLVDVSTQTESNTSTPKKRAVAQPTMNGFETKNQLKREHSMTRESSDGPFLTPPSDYPLPTQPAKRASRRHTQLPSFPKYEPFPEAIPSFHAPLPGPETVPSFHAPVPAPKAIPSFHAPVPAPEAIPSFHAPVSAPEAIPSVHAPVPAPEAIPSFHAPVPAPEAIPSFHAPVPAPEAIPSFHAPVPASEAIPSFHAPLPTVPFQYNIPPPPYALAPRPFLYQYPSWPEKPQEQELAGQPISVITNATAAHQYENPPQCNFSPPEPSLDSSNSSQTEPNEDPPMNKSFEDGRTDVKFTFNGAAEPDYNWDDIEKELSRVCGQVFTGDDDHAMSDELGPVPAPVAPPNEQGNADLDLLGAQHETQLRERLEFISENWSLERQAKLKRRFIELFGREDDEDTLSQVTGKDATKCKQRVAPWIVKHLMPLYKEKRIASRALFKSLAKHISDLLIQRNLYPDECDVWMGVQEFFRGGTNIVCEADFAT